MNLYKKLDEIEKTHKLIKTLKLRVYCNDGDVIEGYYDGYTDAINNTPEVTQLELRRFNHENGIVCIEESEIKDIEVIV